MFLLCRCGGLRGGNLTWMSMDRYGLGVGHRWVYCRVAWVAWMGWVASARPPLWIADQVRNDGLVVGFVLFTLPPCGYCLEASMTVLAWICWTGMMHCIVFTLTLALSHQGRGEFGGCVGLVRPRHTPHLWIDESLITLCQRVRF